MVKRSARNFSVQLIFIDLEKAYDNVFINIIFEVLQLLLTFTNAISIYIYISTYVRMAWLFVKNGNVHNFVCELP